VDICGGLPAVVTEMIIQSSAEDLILLPALPDQWPEGEVKGVLTRCGVTIDLNWEEGKPVSAVLNAQRNTSFQLRFLDNAWKIKLAAGQKQNWIMN
jgi:alpha-L-fucosidase 2